jgi:hypothetical protein
MTQQLPSCNMILTLTRALIMVKVSTSKTVYQHHPAAVSPTLYLLDRFYFDETRVFEWLFSSPGAHPVPCSSLLQSRNTSVADIKGYVRARRLNFHAHYLWYVLNNSIKKARLSFFSRHTGLSAVTWFPLFILVAMMRQTGESLKLWPLMAPLSEGSLLYTSWFITDRVQQRYSQTDLSAPEHPAWTLQGANLDLHDEKTAIKHLRYSTRTICSLYILGSPVCNYCLRMQPVHDGTKELNAASCKPGRN